MRQRVYAFAVTLIAACGVAIGDDASDKPFISVGQPTLRLKVPTGWQDHSRPGGRPGLVVVRLDAMEKTGLFSVQLLYVKPPQPQVFDDNTLKKLVTASSQVYLGTSEEKEVKLQTLDGAANGLHGYYASFTDTSPNPGRFGAVTTLAVRLGDGLLAGTILHQKHSDNLQAALEMIKTATLAAGPATQPAAPAAQPGVLQIPSPDGKWAVLLDLPGVVSVTPDNGNDGKANHLMTTAAGGIIVSAFVEPAARPGNALAARIFYWTKERKAPLTFTAVKMAGDKDLARLDYTADDTDRNAHAYLSHGGDWVDIHLSKIDGTDADVAAMDAALKSARIETAKP